MPTLNIDADPARGGWILQTYDPIGGGTTYTAGNTSIVMGHDPADASGDRLWWRGYASFDTSSVPDRSLITAVTFDVELLVNLASGSNPISWQHFFYSGNDFLGSGGPATSNWGDGATLMGFHNWSGAPSTSTVTFQYNLDTGINKTGRTDYEIIDASTYSGPDDWRTFWYDQTSRKSTLNITYRRLRSMVVVA